MAIQSAQAKIYTYFETAVFGLRILSTDIFETTGSTNTSTSTFTLFPTKIMRLFPALVVTPTMTTIGNMSGTYTGNMGDGKIRMSSESFLNLRIPTTISIDLSKVIFPVIPTAVFTISLTEDFFTEEFNNLMPSPAIASLTTITAPARPTISGQTPFNGQTDWRDNTKVILNVSVQDVPTALRRGGGFYRLYRNGVLATSLNALDTTKVSISGNKITLNLLGFLDAGKNYYILIDNGVVVSPDDFPSQSVASTTAIAFSTPASTDVDFPDLISLVMAAANINVPASEILVRATSNISAVSTSSATLERVRLVSGTSATTTNMFVTLTANTGKFASMVMSSGTMTIEATKYRIEIPLMTNPVTMTTGLTYAPGGLNPPTLQSVTTLTAPAVKTVSAVATLTSSFAMNTANRRVRIQSSVANVQASLSVITLTSKTSRPSIPAFQCFTNLALQRTTAFEYVIDTTLTNSLSFDFVLEGGSSLTSESGTYGAVGVGTALCGVNWGDGTVTQGDNMGSINTPIIRGIRLDRTYGNTRTISKTFPRHGRYVVRIEGPIHTAYAKLNRIRSTGQNIFGCNNFGDSVTSIVSTFAQASNLQQVPTSLPTRITSLESLFDNCFSLNSPNLNSWNTINVTSLYNTFQGCISLNQSLNAWNTSNVTTMRGTFISAYSFNQPLSNWNTAKVTTMELMFYNAFAFNQSLNTWNVSQCRSFNQMFAMLFSSYEFGRRSAYNQPMNNWVFFNKGQADFTRMLYLATSYRQNISNWCVQNATIGSGTTVRSGGNPALPYSPTGQQFFRSQDWALYNPYEYIPGGTSPYPLWLLSQRPNWNAVC